MLARSHHLVTPPQVVSQPMSFFDKNKTGELMNRLSSDTTVVQNAATVNISMGLRFGAQARGRSSCVRVHCGICLPQMLHLSPANAPVAPCPV